MVRCVTFQGEEVHIEVAFYLLGIVQLEFKVFYTDFVILECFLLDDKSFL